MPALPALAPLFASARKAGERALDIVYPPVCIACRRATESHFGLCPECWTRMRFIEKPFCERLGTPFDVDLGQPGLLSPEAIANPPAFSRARSVVKFDDVDHDAVASIAGALTPVPGGTGPVTTAVLGRCLIEAAERQR